jgi:DNA polymerase V
LVRSPCGFPSPADDHRERALDLNEYLVRHPAATCFVTVSGTSREGAGIRHGDTLVVDRSVEPYRGAIVIAAVDGELTVKRLHTAGGRLYLQAENSAFPPIEIRPDQDCVVWGVVVGVVRKLVG